PPCPADTSPLSLHDALPICCVRVASAYFGIEAQRPLPPSSAALSRITRSLEAMMHFVGVVPMASQPDVVTAHVLRAAESSLSDRSEEHTSELQSRENLVCRL